MNTHVPGFQLFFSFFASFLYWPKKPPAVEGFKLDCEFPGVYCGEIGLSIQRKPLPNHKSGQKKKCLVPITS